jgi:hypothetical protein
MQDPNFIDSDSKSESLISEKQEIPLDGIFVIGGFLFLFLLEFLGILFLNDGKFVYTLDDAYIHLAVAEEIARGHYGVNAHEFSAPCSSALWPFLIAPFARTFIAEFVPLGLNALFGILTCWVVLREVRKVMPSGAGLSCNLARSAVSGVILLACNVIGLVFSGMEHNLQVLLSLIVVSGIIHGARTGNCSRMLIVAAVCGPLVRYENLALTVAACAVLFLKRRPAPAVLIGVLTMAGLCLFSGFLVANDHPPMPSSIVAKSHLVGDVSKIASTWNAIQNSFSDGRGLVVLILSAALLCLGMRKGTASSRIAAMAIAGSGLLHVCFGSYGWYNRYECYIFAALLLGFIRIAAEPGEGIMKHWGRVEISAVSLFGLIISFPYLIGLFTIPFASNNIYDQQFQMHRFATQWWKKPVAVNDLGWVSYRNENYVLDLWGLGSSKALKARIEEHDYSWMARMANESGVGLAMVYESWVPGKSVGWIKVGEIYLSRGLITPSDAKVTFYATAPSFVNEIESKLQDFKKSVPPGVVIITRSDMLEAKKKKADSVIRNK